ncbi:MAG: hypothetical protein CL534_11055 [Ahrensia sp.]|nr:hypothetical protein [Ahrensia sp.]
MRRTSFLIVIAATTALASPAGARSTCGFIEEMQPDETLEQLAARCGTEPEEILRVNDAETVADLPEGKLKMPVFEEDAVDDFLGRARIAMEDAGRNIRDAANSAGKTVSDYLADTPDLSREIAEFGERIGLPGDDAEPSRGPEVNVEKKGEGKFEVEASGLPGSRDVRIGLRRGDSLTILDTIETDIAGKLSAEIEVPAETMEAGGDAVIVVETVDERIRLVSDVLALD